MIGIRPYEARFEADLVEICWETGFMGESLGHPAGFAAGCRGRFEDRRLFALIFVLSFPSFDPEACFVAVDDSGGVERAVGYIVGAADAAAQARHFSRRFVPRIALRLFLHDSWRHPESFRQTLHFLRAAKASPFPNPDFPACLHTNLLPVYKGQGLGRRLMETFLAALRGRGVAGVYLETSERNRKALPFYRKLGFELAREEEAELWEGEPAAALTFVKRL